VRAIVFLLLFFNNIYAWKMEADKITVNKTNGNTITHITFRQTYDSVPLVFTLMDDKGSDPASFRVTNVSTTGFDIYTVEPDGEDGPHAKMTQIPYIAIESGAHTLPDGTKIVAGTINTQKYQSRLISGTSWETVTLSGFSTTPVVLGQIQTRINERTDDNVPDAVSRPWMTTAISSVSSSSFHIAIERSETTSGTLNQNETIAYLVMDSGLHSGNHYFGSNAGTKIEYETIRSNDVIQGWDNGDTTINFSKSYHDPIVVATKNTRNGVDGGWLRRGDIANDHITLQVDEDQANDPERSHTTERAGIVLFSEPFDTDFFTSDAQMIINEVMFRENTTGSNNDEFVELYVKSAGDLKGYVVADQDCNYYRFPSCNVNQGDYVIFHTGVGTDSCSGTVKHFYKGKNGQFWNNNNDDILIIRPDSGDVTTTTNTSSCGTETYNGVPEDYAAYGRNSVGSNVDAIPASMHNVTLSWNYDYGTELGVSSSEKGLSIALTPNAVDSDKAACWEKTASGNASDNGCANYIPTRDSNNNANQTNSMGDNNNAMPNMHITKSSIVLNDPVNNSSNPKRIPGATIRYCFVVDNNGSGSADDTTIKDSLSGNGRENLTYIKSGYVIQDNTSACNCQSITDTSGTYDSGTKEVTINLGTIQNQSAGSSSDRGCAYIETMVK